MRIDGPQRYAPPAANGARRTDAGRPAFEIETPQRAGATAAKPAASPVSPLDTLLAVQVVGDSLERRRKGVRRGRAMLDALDALKMSLLGGRVAPEDLARLARSVDDRERDADDARLESLLDEIELRAKVELAKLRASRAA
jgi:hypothetical protein